MDAERISKQSKGNVDQSLLEGTGSGGMLSAGYFNDNSLIERLHDGECVDYTLQNLTKGITVGNGDSNDTISPHSSYRTVLLVTDERLLYVVGQGNGDKTFSVRFEDIRDVEISHGVLKDRIIVRTDDETYDMYTQKGGSLDEASKHISEISEKKAKKSNESSGDEQVKRTNKEVTNNDPNKPPDRPEQSANVPNQSGRNTNSEGNSSNSNSDMSVTVEILVSNTDGEPVPDARIKITGTTLSVDGRTSQTGRCSISISEASESVKMEVNHPDYQSIQEEVTLTDGAVIDITLKSIDSTDSFSEEKSRSDGSDPTETSDTSNGSPGRTELLDELVALNERFSPKVMRGKMRTDGKYSPEDYETAFGSWSTAVDQAPFDRTNESSSAQPNQPTYSRQEVIDALVDLIEKMDGRPSTSDMNDLGRMSASPVYQYFKSWDAAVDAVNKEHGAAESDHYRGQSEESADDTDPESGERTKSDTTETNIDSDKEQQQSSYTSNIPLTSAAKGGDQGPEREGNGERSEKDDFEWGPEVSEPTSDGVTKESEDRLSNVDNLANVPEGRLSNVVAEIKTIRELRSEKRDATFVVELSNGKQVDFTIWNKHNIEIGFQTGDKIRLDEVSLGRWETAHGFAHRLSSSKDLTISPIEGSGVQRPDEEYEGDGRTKREPEREHDIDQLIGVGGATKADAEALMKSGYMTTADLESASLDDLRSVSGLDDGTALRIKAELG